MSTYCSLTTIYWSRGLGSTERRKPDYYLPLSTAFYYYPQKGQIIKRSVRFVGKTIDRYL